MKKSLIQTGIIILSLVVLFLHITYTLPWQIKSQQWYQSILADKTASFEEPGKEFADLKPYLIFVENAGYLSESSTTTTKASIGRALAAQYSLSPTMIRINDTQQKLIILDFTSQDAAEKIMKKMNLEIVYKNPYNIILAQKKIN